MAPMAITYSGFLAVGMALDAKSLLASNTGFGF